MSFRTLEVQIEHGRVIPQAEDVLPEHGSALLTLLEASESENRPVRSAAELVARWDSLGWLSEEEGNAFADDVESARDILPSISSPWD